MAGMAQVLETQKGEGANGVTSWPPPALAASGSIFSRPARHGNSLVTRTSPSSLAGIASGPDQLSGIAHDDFAPLRAALLATASAPPAVASGMVATRHSWMPAPLMALNVSRNADVL